MVFQGTTCIQSRATCGYDTCREKNLKQRGRREKRRKESEKEIRSYILFLTFLSRAIDGSGEIDRGVEECSHLVKNLGSSITLQ